MNKLIIIDRDNHTFYQRVDRTYCNAVNIFIINFFCVPVDVLCRVSLCPVDTLLANFLEVNRPVHNLDRPIDRNQRVTRIVFIFSTTNAVNQQNITEIQIVCSIRHNTVVITELFKLLICNRLCLNHSSSEQIILIFLVKTLDLTDAFRNIVFRMIRERSLTVNEYNGSQAVITLLILLHTYYIILRSFLHNFKSSLFEIMLIVIKLLQV